MVYTIFACENLWKRSNRLKVLSRLPPVIYKAIFKHDILKVLNQSKRNIESVGQAVEWTSEKYKP